MPTMSIKDTVELASRHIASLHRRVAQLEQRIDEPTAQTTTHPCRECVWKKVGYGGGEFDGGRLGTDCCRRAMCLLWKLWYTNIQAHTPQRWFCPKCGHLADIIGDKIKCTRCKWVEP